MKRNWNLILDILTAIEEDDFEDFHNNCLGDSLFDQEEYLDEHYELLAEGGYIEFEECDLAETMRLTWEGHNLLDELKTKVN
jgi:hypothetical protein